MARRSNSGGRRRRSGLAELRNWLYLFARLLGDIQAASRGPNALARRVARRAAGRMVGRTLWRRFR